MTNEEIIQLVEQDNTELISVMLEDLIEGHRAHRGAKMKALHDRYKQERLPIQTRRTRNPNKIDERVPNDFYADIVDTKTGYMGNEVMVMIDKDRAGDRYEPSQIVLDEFQTLNFAVDQNSEAVKMAASLGVVYRLLYVPEGRNEIRMKLIPGYEGIMIRDESLDDAVYFIRYWYVTDHEYDKATGKSDTNRRTVVEWYDDTNITYYIDDGRGNYQLDVSKGNGGMQPHLFSAVPVIEFANNEEMQAEPEKVVNLIDAYDTVISATVSEIEQLRLAYLKYRGGEAVDNEFIQLLEQTGILPLAADGDAAFITKDIQIDPVKVILDEIRKNIYQFAKSIDLSKDFGGDLRVIGWQVSLLNIENSCKVTERKFKKALREQYRLVSEKWREWGVADVDYLDLQFTFTRNFPKDLASEAKILLDLLGTVSRKTAYAQMSFIEDVDAEIEAFEAEREANVDLFGVDSANSRSEDEPDESE